MQCSAVTVAEFSPIPLADLKALARVTHSGEDATLTALLNMAVNMVEDLSGVLLSQRTVLFRVAKGDFSTLPWVEQDILELVRGPVQSIQYIKYYAVGEDTLTTLDTEAYTVTGSLPATIECSAGWPVMATRAYPMEIRASVGYTQAQIQNDMEGRFNKLKQAALLLATHYYEQRIDSVGVQQTPWAIQALITNASMGVK